MGEHADFFHLRHNSLRVTQNVMPLLGGDHSTTVAIEQPRSQLLFQQPYLSAQGRLGNTQPISRL
ncbi:argininosuccinate lyase [Brucella suis 1330]|nr:argininosuccinate lyase [Brucella suis 1330]